MARITIEWESGRPHKGADDDERRAIAAAESILDAAGVDYQQAESEYIRQWKELDGEDGMTGLALVWRDAESAADFALTEGWHNPDGAHCTIRVA